MQHHEIFKLLNDSVCQYSINKIVRFKTLMLRSDLSYYSDPCIVVKGTITVVLNTLINKKEKSNLQE